jgi:hypothetical protein
MREAGIRRRRIVGSGSKVTYCGKVADYRSDSVIPTYPEIFSQVFLV